MRVLFFIGVLILFCETPSISLAQGSCSYNEHGFVLLNCPDRAIALVGEHVRWIRIFCGKPTRVDQKGDASGKYEVWIYEIFGDGMLTFYVLNGKVASYEILNLKVR